MSTWPTRRVRLKVWHLGPPQDVHKASLKRERRVWAMATAVSCWLQSARTVAYFKLARAPERAIIAEIPPPENTQFSTATDPGGPPVLSPDGRTLAFSAVDTSGKTMLWVRSLDSVSARSYRNGRGGCPFWSADNRSVGFLQMAS